MQSIYWYEPELFFADVMSDYFVDMKTGEVYQPAPFQIELREKVRQPVDLLGIVARDHAKTTSVDVLQVVWMLLYQVEESILLITPKALGEKVIGEIRKTLENNKLIRLIYGGLVPIENRAKSSTEKWRLRELQLLNKTEIKSITRGESIRGRRPTKVIIDDPQELKDVKNPRIAAEFYDWVWTTVYPVLSDSGSMVVIGTILSDNCFVNMLANEAVNKDFELISYPAILDFDPLKDVKIVRDPVTGKVSHKFLKGRPLWPSKWPMDKLERRCNKIGLAAFCQEYLNIPMQTNSAPVFRNEYSWKTIEPIRTDQHGIKWYAKVDPSKQYFIGVDPSKGKVDGDPAGVVCRDMDYNLVAQFEGHVIEHLLASLIVAAFVKDMREFMIIPEVNVGLAFLDAAKAFKWFKNIYRKEVFDKVTKKKSESLGFYTTEKSKSILISAYDKLMMDGTHQVSGTIKTQIQKYHYDENGSANAISPYHDDVLVADFLSVHGIRTGIKVGSIRLL